MRSVMLVFVSHLSSPVFEIWSIVRDAQPLVSSQSMVVDPTYQLIKNPRHLAGLAAHGSNPFQLEFGGRFSYPSNLAETWWARRG